MPRPRVEIEYCRLCGWLPRAAWLAQELLSTFPEEIREVALIPGRGGVFEVRCGGAVIHSRAAEGGFADATELKRRIRDRIAPQRDLGHADRARHRE